jgi:TolB protein
MFVGKETDMTKFSRDQPFMKRHDAPRDRSSAHRARKDAMRTRWFVGALVIISAAALVACSGSSKGTATSAPLPGLGVELPASQIPWNEVGPGWILAAWNPTPVLDPGQTPSAGQPTAAPVTLYLLDPAGGRYAITTFPPSKGAGPDDPSHTPQLADWSGDGRHALFEEFVDAGGKTTVTEVDLATGAKQTFTAPAYTSVAYSRPTAQAILESYSDSSSNGYTSTLERVDLSGTKQLTFPINQLGAAGKFNDAYLQTPDGTQLVLGAENGMVVMGHDGVVARQLPMPGPYSRCRPVRWWTSTVILAACDIPPPQSGPVGGSESQLWQVPLAGGAPTAFTSVNGQDLGYQNAWQLPSGTFLDDVPGCGGDGLLFRLAADLQTTQVDVPGVAHGKTVVAIGVTADKLVLMTRGNCGSPHTSLRTYDPAANTSTVLLGAPLNGGDVTRAILYPIP